MTSARNAPHPFGNDIGIGLRWTANDPQSTAILFGGLIDLDTDNASLSLEAERRLGVSKLYWKPAFKTRLVRLLMA